MHKIILLAGFTALINGCQPVVSIKADAKLHENMQFVQGATYRMGSDPDELEEIRAATGLETINLLMSEVPSREVTVTDFYIDTFDVTNQRFAHFVQSVREWSKERADDSLHNGRYLEHWADGDPPANLMEHPVTFVTWHAAVAYCDWQGKRLLTEIEYEWAAQNAATATEYPWGNMPPDNDVVNWSGSDIRTTVPVGSYPPNARGLYDMSGNVWQFTADPWLGSYAEMLVPSMNAAKPATSLNARKVVRGGSWGANAANLRVRYRDSHRAFDAREMVGFRCAVSADSK